MAINKNIEHERFMTFRALQLSFSVIIINFVNTFTNIFNHEHNISWTNNYYISRRQSDNRVLFTVQRLFYCLLFKYF
jgi:hypothetical protein